MSTDGTGVSSIEGVEVGHWTDAEARTGCTVVLLPEGTVASGEVRGGAPATREWALLDPLRTVAQVDAVVLSGGSAFGLAAGGGVAEALEATRGYPTPAGRVPIVVGLSLFDLLVGDASVRPTAADGRRALADARRDAVELGAIGAGTGCTHDKVGGDPRPAGLGSAAVGAEGVRVAALVAVNAVGRVGAGEGPLPVGDRPVLGSTVIGVVVTDARLDKVGCHLVAQGGHDGLARAIDPPHTTMDGDALVAAATGRVDAPVDLVRALAVRAVAQAVRAAAEPGGVSGPG